MQATLEAPLSIIQKEPHPKQRTALWLLGLDPYHPPPGGIPVNELLFGGMASGGKSMLIRFIIATIAQQWPGSKVAVFRRASPDLTKTQIMPLLQDLPVDAGQFNWHHMTYTWANGSTTEFNHCYESDDHLRFKSFEWDVLIFDESTEFLEDQLTFLRSRCRSTRPGWYPVIVYATNPGGVSHLWHKRTFVDARESGEPFWGPWEAAAAGLATEGREDFRYRRCYLRSRLWDNPSLPPHIALAMLAAISDPELRKALAEGDWNLHAGQFFSDFRDNIHVCQPFDIPSDWYVWRAVDWGSAAPAACVWGARDPSSDYLRTYIFRYWQRAGLADQIQAQTILNLSRNDPPARLTLADPSMFNKTMGAVGQTHAQQYEAAHLHLTKANNRRHPGWARIRQALSWETAQGPGLATYPPELQIFKHTDLTNTGDLIRWIANVERSKDDEEDIKEPNNLTDSVNDLRDEAGDCCAEGTLVNTSRGEVAIEDIVVGDQVWTRDGLRKVTDHWLVNESAPCVTVWLSNFRFLTATPDHRVWVEGKGWIAGDSLRYGDIIEPWQYRKQSPSTASFSGATLSPTRQDTETTTRQPRTIGGRGWAHSIRRFGSRLTGLFRPVISYTTMTAILSTTIPVISSASPIRSTIASTDPPTGSKGRGSSWIWGDWGQPSGTDQQREEPGILSTLKRSSRRFARILSISYVAIVAKTLIALRAMATSNTVPAHVEQQHAVTPDSITRRELALTAGVRLSATVTTPSDVVPVRVLLVTATEPAPVYDLTVEGAHEFYANGVLVHNCMRMLLQGAAAVSRGKPKISRYTVGRGRR